MNGKVVVATGATSGIGAVAVETLAKRGARIVFIARDEARAKASLDRLYTVAPEQAHRAHFADLALIRETKRIGEEIAAIEPRIDVLINNAGALFSDRRITAEGLEATFALNHMSYFSLTKTLLPRLKASAPARIVSTASRAHQQGRLKIEDLQSRLGYSGYSAYGGSKLANILFTRELARRLAGTDVTANCLHPGVVATRFAENAGGWFGRLIGLARPFMISPEAAKVSGGYFAKRKTASLSAAARDDALAAKLWDASEALYAAH
jgi:NAD(P)-dependent dehydrogenase (short-subunit alcohol dehydrogenase family)